MPTHDPIAFATGLSTKLATRARHVCVFLGAGIGRACGLPDMIQLKDRVLDGLEAEERVAFEVQMEGCNIEEALSRVRRIAALLRNDQTIDGLTATSARQLDEKVCQLIVKALDMDQANIDTVQYFASWAARADYRLPLEIFTINYDLLLETAFESLGVTYFDGFVGNLRARFRTELVETPISSSSEALPSFFVRLWKLHGSVNWAWQDSSHIVRLGQSVPDNKAAAIYPSDTKYEESRRVPFVVLQDRFRRALHQPETLLLISGYSFGDAHLNELIFDAARRRERSEIVVFCFSEIPTVLDKEASRTANLQVVTGKEAIIGGVRLDWSNPGDSHPNLWEADNFTLRDFKFLARYLAQGGNRESDVDIVLRKIIDNTITNQAKI